MFRQNRRGVNFPRPVCLTSRRPGLFIVAGIASFLCSLSGCLGTDKGVGIRAGSLEIGITEEGMIGSFADLSSGKEYLPTGVKAPLLTLRVAGRDLEPLSAVMDASGT